MPKPTPEEKEKVLNLWEDLMLLAIRDDDAKVRRRLEQIDDPVLLRRVGWTLALTAGESFRELCRLTGEDPEMLIRSGNLLGQAQL